MNKRHNQHHDHHDEAKELVYNRFIGFDMGCVIKVEKPKSNKYDTLVIY